MTQTPAIGNETEHVKPIKREDLPISGSRFLERVERHLINGNYMYHKDPKVIVVDNYKARIKGYEVISGIRLNIERQMRERMSRASQALKTPFLYN